VPVSLDAWEERALKSIADDLAASAPEFASRLLVFNRLTSGEQMPEDPQVMRGEQRRGHRRARPRRGSWRGRAGWMRDPVMRPHGRTLRAIPVIAILAVFTAIMIAIALVLGGSGPGGTRASHCARAWPMTCSSR
jgi:hypothetical protein